MGEPKITLNEGALEDLGRRLVADATRKIDQDMDACRGQAPDQVRPLLEQSMRRNGITPNTSGEQFERMVEVIAQGGHLRG